MSNSNITKNAIAATMKTLMETKPLAKISVGDITSACGITRNSFYYHFKDKFDLVNWIFYSEFLQAINISEYIEKDPWRLIEDVCTYFYNERVFYQNAFSVQGQNDFSSYAKETLRTMITSEIERLYSGDEDSEMCATIFVQVFVEVIERWVTDDAQIPVEKFCELIKKTFTIAVDRLS